MSCEMSSVTCQPQKQPGILDAKDVSCTKTEIAKSSKCSSSDGFNLTFKQLQYKVRTGSGLRFKRDWKYILKQISGEFISGELTGIIGLSGSGKTTLMNILAGYTISGVKGKVMFNGVKGRLARCDGCYIMQDSQLQPLLTVIETITFAAHLKLGSSISSKERKQMIDSILESLYLTDCYHTLTHKLSGGQRKRLSIGLELLTNPPVMFFDEPTSGLDISSSKQCLGIMKSLAAENRIVVCSIHQPSALLLEMFDHLYAMADGECIYQGGVSNITKYLCSLGFNCPRYYNPADFVLELPFEDSSGVLSNHQRLVNGSANGFCEKWRKSYTHINSSSQNISLCTTSKSVEFRTDDHSLLISYNKILHHKQCSSSLWYQIFVLLNRSIIRLCREKFFMRMRLSLHILFGCFIGLFYRGIGNDAAHVFDNFSLLFFCLMFLMFTAFSAMIMAFPSELPIITREYFNCWYSLKSYYLAVVIADVIFQVMCTFTYCLLVYLISYQPRDMQRFVMFTLMYILVSLVSQGMGLFVGASMRVQHGMVFGPLFISPWVIFSGFFLHLNDAAPFFHWIFHISFLKHGLEGVMDSIYGNNRSRLPCSEDYCHFISPKKLLKELDMIHNDYWTNFYILSSYIVVLYTITYFMLKYQVCHKR